MHKGSIKATEGQPVIIPLNMKDGIIIGIGKGNKTWNSSAPHGAGRLLTRSEANALLELKDYQEMMAGIHSLTVNKSTLDESPFVYKEPKMIIKAIEDVVKIEYIATPIYNYKERST